jgi:hypothetical protein
MTTELILFTILDLRCALKKDRQHEERGWNDWKVALTRSAVYF